MKKYVAVVAITVAAHFAYLVFVPSGGFLALRWRRMLWWHVPAVIWGVGVVRYQWPCPLTFLEQWARARGGMTALPVSGFTERYVAGVFYPARGTPAAQSAAFVAAGASWTLLLLRRRRGVSPAAAR